MISALASTVEVFLWRWMMHSGVFLLAATVVHFTLYSVALSVRIAKHIPVPRCTVLLTEASWSVFSSCTIVTGIEMLLESCLAHPGGRIFEGFNKGWLEIALMVTLLSLWGDAHFYWTHRFLHAVPWLYRHVHSVHH